MTYKEFCQNVRKAGLTLKDLAILLRMHRASISNLSGRDEVPSHLAVISVLLVELAVRNVDIRQTLSTIDIHPKKPRGAPGKAGDVRGVKGAPPL